MNDLKSHLTEATGAFAPTRSTAEALGEVKRRSRRGRTRRRAATALVALVISSVGLALLVPWLAHRPHSAGPATGGPALTTAYTVQVAPDTGVAVVSRVDLSSLQATTLVSIQNQAVVPSLEVSPDGSTVYLLDRASDGSTQLDVVDASNGQITATKALTTLSPVLSPVATDALAVDASGRVFIYGGQVIGSDNADFSVRTYATASGDLLTGSVDLSSCGPSPFMFAGADSDLALVCPETRNIHWLAISGDGSASSDSTLSLPPSSGSSQARPDDRVVAAGASPDGGTLYVATENGRLFVVSSSSHSVTTTRTIPLSQDGYVVFGGLHVTPSGDSAIVATGDPADFNGFQATGVVQMALADGTALHVAELPAPALSSLMVPFGEDEVVTVQAQTVVLTGLADGSPSGSVQLPNVGGVGSLNLAVAPPTTN